MMSTDSPTNIDVDPIRFTNSGLKDSLFLNLCKVQTALEIPGKEVQIKVIIPDKEGRTRLIVNKYFYQAVTLTPSIILGKPTPYFPIEISDIEFKIVNELNELKKLDPITLDSIVRKAILKVFEITSPNLCYFSIAPKLKWKKI